MFRLLVALAVGPALSFAHARGVPPALVWDALKGNCPAGLDWPDLRGKVIAVSITEEGISPDDIADWNEFAVKFEKDAVVSIRVAAGSEFLLDQALSRRAAKPCILFDPSFANQRNFQLPRGFLRTVVIDQSGLIAGYSQGDPDEDTIRSVLHHETAAELTDAPPMPREIDPAAGIDPVPSFEVHITPSKPREIRELGAGGPDWYIARNQPLNVIIMDLWQTPSSRILFPEKLDKTAYTITAHIPAPDGDLLLRLTREAVMKRFGLAIEKQQQVRRVYVLRAVGDRTPRLRTAAESDDSPMTGVSETSIIGTAQPPEEIGKAFEGWLDAPVIDETVLKGLFDYSASSKQSGSAGAFDMARQLGLELQAEDRSIEVLVVRETH